MFVEHIQDSTGKSPEKKQGGDEDKGYGVTLVG
jgi:hypothetical protein